MRAGSVFSVSECIWHKELKTFSNSALTTESQSFPAALPEDRYGRWQLKQQPNLVCTTYFQIIQTGKKINKTPLPSVLSVARFSAPSLNLHSKS